jgi:thiol-disulfide isomerase/thioredoxin
MAISCWYSRQNPLMKIFYRLIITVMLFVGAWLMTLNAQSNALTSSGAAPELVNNVFLNTDVPLRLADLRGQVVLLEFWTFDCINCIRTLPYVQRWHESYVEQGLVVIGNHYPEFGYERDLANVEAALTRLNVTYPIAQDNNRGTWSAYSNRFWPTILLIDKQGNIRYRHIGEGRYPNTEAAIQTLLAEPYTPPAAPSSVPTRQYLRPTQALNVRSGAGTEFERVGTVSPNVVMIVLGERNGWYEVEYDGQRGRYVSGEYVTVANW